MSTRLRWSSFGCIATVGAPSDPITVGEARELGLPISTEMPVEVFDLMQLYPQTSQRRPSVEYVPLPYGPREPTPRRPERTREERNT